MSNDTPSNEINYTLEIPYLPGKCIEIKDGLVTFVEESRLDGFHTDGSPFVNTIVVEPDSKIAFGPENKPGKLLLNFNTYTPELDSTIPPPILTNVVYSLDLSEDTLVTENDDRTKFMLIGPNAPTELVDRKSGEKQRVYLTGFVDYETDEEEPLTLYLKFREIKNEE